MSHAISSTSSHNNVLRVELDSHADTCVVGRHALLIHEHPKVVMVSGLDHLNHLKKLRLLKVLSSIHSETQGTI